MQKGIDPKLTPKMRLKKTKGEIIQVEGGQIVRSLGRKDRHSKVYTAKGPRDRRVRLSADTAIQVYDVQDRLGYDRPSKAIDWLMKEAKAAIDALNQDQKLEVPANVTSLYDPCAAFHRTTGGQVQNGQDSVQKQATTPFNINQGLHTCFQENPFSSSSSGNAKEEYYPFAQNHELFADDHRESLQSSFAPAIHATINGSGNDDWFLAFPFLQGIHGNEEESYR